MTADQTLAAVRAEVAAYEADRLQHLRQPNAAMERIASLLADTQPAAAPSGASDEPRKVFLVCTGEVVDGRETYTRHDDAPPPLCDAECLYTQAPARVTVEMLDQLRADYQMALDTGKTLEQVRAALAHPSEAPKVEPARCWACKGTRSVHGGFTCDVCSAPTQTKVEARAVLTNEQKALNYYRAAVEHRAPAWVPSKVRLPRLVRGDPPIGHATLAPVGDYDCDSNQWGAVSVRAANGRMLGIKPAEFEPLEWRENAIEAAGGTGT
jgi:hypothetical protein